MMKLFGRLIEHLENSKINLFNAFLLFLIITSIRIYTEFYIWVFVNDFYIVPAFFEEYVHQFMFYSTVFLGGVLIISYFAKTHVIKVIKIVLYGWWVLILPPLIDYVVIGRTEGYRYGLPEDFLKNIFTLGINVTYIGVGQLIMGLVICSLSAFYILCKSKSFARTIAGATSIFIMMLTLGNPELYLPFGIEYKLLLYFWYLSFSAILAFFIVYRANKKIVSGMIKDCKPMRTLHFAFMTIIGLLVAGEVSFFKIADYPYIITTIITIVLIWQYTSLINDVYDKGIDQISNKQRSLITGLMNESQYIHLALISAIFSLGAGALLGIIPFILTVVGILLGTVYSMPPIRLKNYLFSSCVIGAGSSIAFLIGYYSPDFGGNIAGLTPKAILIMVLIFIALSLAPATTDLKDYYGDKRMNVKTIYTIYGREKGKQITSVLLFLTFLIPLILYHSVMDFVLFLSLASFAMVIFVKKESVRVVALCYGIALFYSILYYYLCAKWLPL